MLEQMRVVTRHCRGPLFIAFEGHGRQNVTFISIIRSSSIQRSSSNDAQKTLSLMHVSSRVRRRQCHVGPREAHRHDDLRQRLRLSILEPREQMYR